MNKKIVRKEGLTAFTHARVGLGHTGGHLKTNAWLDFQAGFVQAKDAVNSFFSPQDLLTLPALEVNTMASQLQTFLMRPDLGKQLTKQSAALLKKNGASHKDLLIIVSGGLSPLGIKNHAANFLNEFLIQTEWSVTTPVIITQRSRVALGDAINEYVQAKVVVMLIGERPGLSTPDSMGIYITHSAHPGCDDSQRNCISNIHTRGLSYRDAATKLTCLLELAFKAGFTGVMLKDY